MKYFFLLLFLPLTACVSHGRNENLFVKPGAYQVEEYSRLLEGKSVGIVANHTSIIDKIHLIDTIINFNRSRDLNIKITKVFSPEHGFAGTFDAGSIIESEEQKYDSIKIISLYGSNRKPKEEDLQNIDIMLFDLQDVGTRFYTYISTLHYVMQACAELNIPLIILDRPNPHTHYVDGPVLEEAFSSFVGMHNVPIVYGMTIGEYGQMINGEGWLGDSLKCELQIIKIANYKRNSVYDFPLKPSPNLPNMRSILLYPSLCLFEGTVMSIGRGTAYPFQVVGHPDYPDQLFSFTPVSTPGASLSPKLEDEVCYGVDFSTIPLDSLRTVSEIKLSYLIKNYDELKMNDSFFIDYFKLLAGTEQLQKQIVAGKTGKEIRASWKPGLEKFKEIRKKYLIYK